MCSLAGCSDFEGCLQAKAEELKGPKKLSEFKVNPSIAATLGALPGGAAQLPQAKAASNGTIPAVHAQAGAPADLLLELEAPAAAAPAPSGVCGRSAAPASVFASHTHAKSMKTSAGHVKQYDRSKRQVLAMDLH